MNSFRRISRLSLCLLVFLTLLPPTRLHAGKGGFGPAVTAMEVLQGAGALAGSITAGLGAPEGVAVFVANLPQAIGALPTLTQAAAAVPALLASPLVLPIAGTTVIGGGLLYGINKYNKGLKEKRRIRIEAEEAKRLAIWQTNYWPDGTPRIINGEPTFYTPSDEGAVPMTSYGPHLLAAQNQQKKSDGPKKKDDKGSGGNQGSGNKGPGADDAAAATGIKKLLDDERKKGLRPLKDCNKSNTTEAQALAHCPPPKPSANPEVCAGKADTLKEGIEKARAYIGPQDQTKISPNIAKEGSFEGMITGREYRNDNGANVAGYRIDVDPVKGVHVNAYRYNAVSKHVERVYFDCSGVSGQSAMNALKPSNGLNELLRAKQHIEHFTKELPAKMRLETQIAKVTNPKLRDDRFNFVEQTLKYAVRMAKKAAGRD